jgi:hypothetical protein
MCRRNVGESLAVDRSVVKAVPLTLKETMPSAGPRRSIFSAHDVQSRRSEVNLALDNIVLLLFNTLRTPNMVCGRQTWTLVKR